MFCRLSLTIESDDEYFSLAYYQKIIYENWIFDMAKLMDIAAIYGKSNNSTGHKIVQNVFDNEPRFVQDFKETVDLVLALMKSRFKEFQKIQSIIKGEYIETVSVSD